MPRGQVSAGPLNPRGAVQGEPPEDIPRDRWQRPLIAPSGTTRAPSSLSRSDLVAYTRASTLGGTLEDQTALGIWRGRQVAFGLARRRDLVMAAAAVPTTDDPGDKKRLGEIAESAMEAAESSAKATIGTALHALTERVDRGEKIPDIGEDQATLDAYVEAMSAFTVVASEVFTVCDDLSTAGTFDRLISPTFPIEAPDGTVIEPGECLIDDLKGLALDTPIPTPDGWTTMTSVTTGDRVFGSDGRPCTVTGKSDVKRIGTYVVTFSDGESITCDREHLWWVRTGTGYPTMTERVVDVETLAARTHNAAGKALHRVPVAAPLDLPDVELPIDPYLLGCWIGDGVRSSSRIICEPELFELLAADGHSIGEPVRGQPSGAVEVRSVHGLVTELRRAGYLGHKRIPAEYVRGSIAQRTALLQGLMDTDGTWKQGNQQASFTTIDKALAEEVGELVASLGMQPRVRAETARGFGIVREVYTVQFTPLDLVPFRLSRKVAACATRTRSDARSRHRTITSIEPGPDVDTACIAVDSPNRTYLCGRSMIPTHNTAATSAYFSIKFAVQLAVYGHGTPYSHARGRMDWADLGDGARAPRTDWALILHMPSGGSIAEWYWVDLRRGLELAHKAIGVRSDRRDKTLIAPAEIVPAVRRSGPTGVVSDAAVAERLRTASAETIHTAIAGARSEAALTSLWQTYRATWTPEHTEAVRARLPELRGANA